MPNTPDLAALSEAAHCGNFQRRKFLEALEAEYRAGRLVQIDEEMSEKVALALCQNALGPKQCACAEKGVFNCADAYPGYQADAAIAAMGGAK